jgi:membrane protease YdiL (CAAX protease family)
MFKKFCGYTPTAVTIGKRHHECFDILKGSFMANLHGTEIQLRFRRRMFQALKTLIFIGFNVVSGFPVPNKITNRAMTTFCMGLLVFYGANELFYRVANVLFNSRTNLNDMTIAASINAAPRLTALIIVFLAPFVEEVLFRGLVFGCLKEKSRVAAYVISCVLFAFMHVWTFALSSWDWSYLILMLQYLVPGLVFAWAFDHSGTLWTSILLHATVNALALWAIVG